MIKLINSFGFAWNGFRTAWREEQNFRIETVVALLLISTILVLKFSYLETAIIVLCVTLVLAAEMVNTAVEDLCNKIEPNHDGAIGKIKDLMAGFTLVCSGGSVIVGLIIFYAHFI